MVDDPYLFGQIAAANSLSDIYAMGADPTFVLNLLCVPNCLPLSAVKGILEGGYQKVHEAGAVVAGGHTIEDVEPKYGLCCTGMVHPDKVWSNAGAQVGDVLVITKPIGSGIAITAYQAELMDDAAFAPAVAAMTTLNAKGKEAIARVGANACTDITGFGLLGHSVEMAAGSGVTLQINAGRVPLLPRVVEMAKMGLIPKAAYNNKNYIVDEVEISRDTPLYLQDLLYDPQTSGGLMASVAEEKIRDLMEAFAELGVAATIIGQVVPAMKNGVKVQVI